MSLARSKKRDLDILQRNPAPSLSSSPVTAFDSFLISDIAVFSKTNSAQREEGRILTGWNGPNSLEEMCKVTSSSSLIPSVSSTTNEPAPSDEIRSTNQVWLSS